MIVKKYITGPIEVNTYLVHDEEGNAFIVDPGDYSPECMEYINNHTLDVKYIILTHGHGDHIGGVEEFKKMLPGAQLLASEDEKEMLFSPMANSSMMICGRPISLTADRWLKDEDRVSVGTMELRILKTPGHTKGGICIVVGDVCFSGDTLFRFSIGRTDFPESNYYDLERAIKGKLYKLPDDTLVYPGHMEETTIGLEKKMNFFVKA